MSITEEEREIIRAKLQNRITRGTYLWTLLVISTITDDLTHLYETENEPRISLIGEKKG